MKKTVWIACLIALPALAGTSLTSKAKAAFTDIQRAKTALNQGKTKTSESYLTKSQVLLSSVMQKSPGHSTPNALSQAPSQLSQAESEASRLDPALAGRFGVTQQPAAVQQLADKAGLSSLESTYEKVTLAKSLLHTGDTAKAKSVLDEVPSSPAGVLEDLKR